MESSGVLGPEFERWQNLTDRYAVEILAMARREAGAQERVRALAHALIASPHLSDGMATLEATDPVPRPLRNAAS